MTDNAATSRMEIAIEKLTLISSNLDKLLSVHEHRLNEQEKQINQIDMIIEKRREALDSIVSEIYNNVRKEDKILSDETTKQKEETLKREEKILNRIAKLEQTIWLYLGGFSVIVFLITYGQSILKLITVAK